MAGELGNSLELNIFQYLNEDDIDEDDTDEDDTDEEDTDENVEYTVEKILDSRVTYNGQIEYLCKWKDFTEEDNTWELAEILECQELIEEFKMQRSIKNHKRKAEIIENEKYETKAKKLKLDTSMVILNAFDSGYKAAKILSASMAFDRILFLIEFKELDQPEFVSSNVAYEHIPQMVLRFYEKHFKLLNTFSEAST